MRRKAKQQKMFNDRIDTNQSMYSYIKEAINGQNLEKVSYFGNKISSETMFDEIDKIACFLQEKVAVGECVAICLPNIPQAIFCFYAINKIGAVANIIHPRIKTRALIKILQETNCKWIFMFDRFLREHSKALKENNIMAVGCSASFYMKGITKLVASAQRCFYPQNTVKYTDIVCGGIKNIENRTFSGQADAVLLHSSGTTGEQKTVKLSSYAFNELAQNVKELVLSSYSVKETDGMLMILPMFHGFGLGICVHLMMLYGRAIQLPVFSQSKVVKLLKKEKVEIISGVPSMFRRLANYKKFGGKYLANIKLLFCGGDKLESEVKQKFENILKKYGSDTKIMEGYGLSETASVVTINIDGKDDGSLGVPLPRVELKISCDATAEKENTALTKENTADIEKANAELGAANYNCVGNVGEILISTPSVMNGYLKGDSPIVLDEQGNKWLRTGDIGYLDNDGKLYYKGREKRMHKVGGVNIFPQEVEKKAEELAEIVHACAVRMIFDGKPALKLLVVTNDGKLSFGLKNKITNKIREELLTYAVPKIIENADKLKLTMLGKVDYKYYEDLEQQRLQRKDTVLQEQ